MAILNFQSILQLRCKLEAFITEREGMIAENLVRNHRQESPAYAGDSFDELTVKIINLHDRLVSLGGVNDPKN